MRLYIISVFLTAVLFVHVAHSQGELSPEPGVLAEVDRYDLKLREAFSEAFEDGVELRAMILGSFSPELAFFVDAQGDLVTLSPKRISIWNHEHRELVRRGAITRSDADGRQIPPEEEDEAESRIPEKISDIKMVKKSRAISRKLMQVVREVWEDALIHAKHAQKPRSGLDGTRYHYSCWIRGRGVLSGTVWSPDEGTVPRALNDVLTTLIDYVSKEANESHVSSALWMYKVATKARNGGMAKISIREPAEVIPIAYSVVIARSTILEEFTVDNVRLEVALQKLTAESAKYAKLIGYDGISFSAGTNARHVKVSYRSKGESMKSICEALAKQAGAEFDFNESGVVFSKRSTR
jgi:hypothetical protein